MTLSWKIFPIVLFIFLLTKCSYLSAQNEPSIWLFGNQNGIDFRSGTPVAISHPTVSLHGAEVKGVATVTDADGNLLFYTENENVYNSQHNVMLNGAGIYSNWSAAQTGLAVRAIHDTTLYYLFTINMHSVAGESYSSADLWYSIIDMKADNGLGAVTTKNAPLLANTTTQLCAVRHCNERDIWVITHEWLSNRYYAFLVTPEGISSTPVISPGMSGSNDLNGYMKGSPDGKKLAANYHKAGADLSDFDNSTGIVSNTIPLNLMNNFRAHAGGVEFSPNSAFVYATYSIPNAGSFIYQYNVNAGSPATIVSTRELVASVNFFGYYASMQKRPDGKIYIANYGHPNVSIIHQPNIQGAGCNFQFEGLALNTRSSHGFPAYMESKYYPNPPFTFSIECPTNKLNFNYEKPDNIISVKWDFDDPASGIKNNSTELNTVHEFTEERTYNVKLIRFTACSSDTLEEQIFVRLLDLELGNDTTACTNNGFFLETVQNNTSDYLWQDGSTSTSLTALSSGLYWLQITDRSTGCFVRDSISLDLLSIPDFSLGPDQETCDPVIHFEIDVPISTSYLWNTGGNENNISISTPGIYWLQVNNGKCFYRDSIEVYFNSLSVNIGPDTTVCENEILILDAGNNDMDYTWQDGSTNSSFTVKSPGLYMVKATKGICTATDTVLVNYRKKPVFSLGEDKQICKGDVLVLGVNLEDSYSYSWNNGSVSKTISVYQPGTYEMKATNECGTFTDAVNVQWGGCRLAVPNAFTPNNDGRNDIFKISQTESLINFSMQVFNRWGQKVFQSTDQTRGWDGTFGNKICEAGNYAYNIHYQDPEGKPVKLNGVVILIR